MHTHTHMCIHILTYAFTYARTHSHMHTHTDQSSSSYPSYPSYLPRGSLFLRGVNRFLKKKWTHPNSVPSGQNNHVSIHHQLFPRVTPFRPRFPSRNPLITPFPPALPHVSPYSCRRTNFNEKHLHRQRGCQAVTQSKQGNRTSGKGTNGDGKRMEGDGKRMEGDGME